LITCGKLQVAVTVDLDRRVKGKPAGQAPPRGRGENTGQLKGMVMISDQAFGCPAR
jgi:hypothetical protein